MALTKVFYSLSLYQALIYIVFLVPFVGLLGYRKYRYHPQNWHGLVEAVIISRIVIGLVFLIEWVSEIQ